MTGVWRCVCLLFIVLHTCLGELCVDTAECQSRISSQALCDQPSEADFIYANCRKLCGLCVSPLVGGVNSNATVAPPPGCQDEAAEIVFVLDASSSVGEANFQKVRVFTQQVTQRLQAEYQRLNVTVITFSNQAQVILRLNDTVDVNAMVAAESNITYTHGGTQTHKALQLAYQSFHHDVTSPKIAIVITDGASFEPDLTRQAAAMLKNNSVTIFVVAVGDDVNPHETKDISSDPDERYMRMLRSFNDLHSIVGVFHTRNCTVSTTPMPTTTTTPEPPSTQRSTTITEAPRTEPPTAPITETQKPGAQAGATPTAKPVTVIVQTPTAKPPFIMPSTTPFIIKTPGAIPGGTPSAKPNAQTGGIPSLVPPVVTASHTGKPTLQTGTPVAPETTTITTTTTDATVRPTSRSTTTTTVATPRPTTKSTTTTTVATPRPTTKSTTTTTVATPNPTTKSTTTTTAATPIPTTKSTTTTTVATPRPTTKSTPTTTVATPRPTTKSTTTTTVATPSPTTKSTTTTTVATPRPTTKSTTTTTIATPQMTTKSTTTTTESKTRPTTKSSTKATPSPTTKMTTATTAATTEPTRPSTTTTEAPKTTKPPTTTTVAPTTPSTQPTPQPTTTTVAATLPATRLATTTKEPVRTTNKPVSTTTTQEPTTSEPSTQTTKTTEAPTPPSTRPITTTEEPVRTTKKPVPTTTTQEPTTQEPTTQTTTTEEPVRTTKKPMPTTTDQEPTTQEPTTQTTTTEEPVRTTKRPLSITTTQERTTTTTDNPVTTPTEPPTTTTASCIAKIADIVFVVDTSGSIGLANFEKVKAFIKEVIMTFDVDSRYTRVGLIEYSTDAHIEFKLNDKTNLTELLEAVDNVTYSGGGTSTAEALQLMRMEGFERERPAAPDIAVVITDGLSKFPSLTRAQANLAKADGITMFSIGIGNDTAHSELLAIASNQHYVFQVGDYETLLTLDNVVAHRACGIELPEEYHSRSTTTPRTTPGGCVDLDSNCDSYPRDSCTDYEPYARQNCARKCGYCPGYPIVEPPCEDTEPNCGLFGSDICTSSSQYDWVDQHCRKFCSFCGNKTEVATATTPATTVVTTAATCFDLDPKCAKYGDSDMCTQPSYASWAKYNCRKFCNYCYSYHTVTSATVNQVSCPKWTLPEQCTLEISDGQCCPYPKCPDGFKLTIKRRLK